MSDAYVYTVMFDQGVLAAVGGPLLGLVIARWIPRRGATPVAVVVMVLVTIMLQGIFESTRSFREIWPWTHFFGPFGVDGDPERWLVIPGSPYWYAAYLAALCVIGVLVALYRDHESPRGNLRNAIVVVAVIAAAFCVLAMTGGFDSALVNPLPSGKA
jgi:ABC-type branched-subunit amino acid transport system permease subunit